MWIDFTGSKDFSGPNDQIVSTLMSGSSTQTISFTVPVGFAGPTFARGRITSQSFMPGPSDDVSTGEVEDYELYISCDP